MTTNRVLLSVLHSDGQPVMLPSITNAINTRVVLIVCQLLLYRVIAHILNTYIILYNISSQQTLYS